MRRALTQVAAHIAGLDEDGFLGSRLVIDAVAMNLLVVGETSNKLSEGLKRQIPAPWREIVGLRHFLAHDYFGMRADKLWLTASVSAPELLGMVESWQART